METGHKIGTLLSGEVTVDTAQPVAALSAQIAQVPLDLVHLFVSPKADFAAILAEADTIFPDTDVIACTTAGEIGSKGYAEDTILAIGYPVQHFATTSLLVEDLDNPQDSLGRIAIDRLNLAAAHPGKPSSFGFLLVDGLSLREDALTAALSLALRDMPLFGGSAGDGTAFKRTRVALNGTEHQNAAVLTLVQTDHQVKVFSIDHLRPTEGRMVVTEADPARRIVKSINAEPAAREYARIVGKDPEQLDRFTFAAHPVVVRIGSTHHVRAIQQVNEAGELVFFSAIDEGMVLTIAEPLQLAEHLDEALSEITAQQGATDIIGCDCILRRLEAEQTQQTQQVSSILRKHNVIGFSTYGEQIGPLHVNHTMTGVALTPADQVCDASD